MNYFVTGGAGFIGSNYVQMLLTERLGPVNKVKVLDKLTYAGSLENLREVSGDSRFTFINGDICDEDLVKSHISQDDVIVHFAAESHVDRSITGPSEFIRTNVMGTQVLLSSALANRAKLFLQVSTDEVYGSVSVGSSKESHPLLPNSPYSASKAASDLLVRSFVQTYGLDARITRCCNNYGPRQFPEKLIPLAISNLLQGVPIPIYGDGTNIREWIHVQDHCRGIQKVIDTGRKGEVYNIGTNELLSNNTLADILISMFSFSVSMKDYVKDRKGHDFRYALNSEKIRELGFKPEISILDGLVETVNWYRHLLENSS
jgi:dTDP-glucose 4,6-dehydratase